MNSKDYSNSVKLDNPVLAAGLIAGMLYLFLAFVGNGLVANPEVVSKDKALVYFKLVKDGAVWFSLAFGVVFYLWVRQAAEREQFEQERMNFYSWSASLPQWQAPYTGAMFRETGAGAGRPAPVAVFQPIPQSTATPAALTGETAPVMRTGPAPVARMNMSPGAFREPSIETMAVSGVSFDAENIAWEIVDTPKETARSDSRRSPEPTMITPPQGAPVPAMPEISAVPDAAAAAAAKASAAAADKPRLLAAALPRLTRLHDMARRLGTLKRDPAPVNTVAPAGAAPAPSATQALTRVVEECTALAGPAPAIPAGLTPNVLRKTNPGELMRLVKDAYRLMGYDVVNMNAGRGLDTGIDLLVQGQGEIFLFVFWQDGSVDVPLEKVREVLGIAVGEGATRGIVVSPGGFSRAAVKFAHQKGNGRLELMDVRVLQKLLDSAAASPAQTTPACPCCGGRMEVSGKVRVKGRRTLAWHCLSAPACAGTVAMGHHNTGVIVR